MLRGFVDEVLNQVASVGRERGGLCNRCKRCISSGRFDGCASLRGY